MDKLQFLVLILAYIQVTASVPVNIKPKNNISIHTEYKHTCKTLGHTLFGVAEISDYGRLHRQFVGDIVVKCGYEKFGKNTFKFWY